MSTIDKKKIIEYYHFCKTKKHSMIMRHGISPVSLRYRV